MPTISDDARKAAIWYWPSYNAGATKISFGIGPDDMTFEPVHEGSTNRTAGGRQVRVHLGSYFRCTMTVSNHANRALHRALVGLEDHLRRGGTCAISANTVKAYASYVTTKLYPGDTKLKVQGSPFPSGVQTNGQPDVTFAAGDELVVQSAWPDSRYEVVTVTSHSGNTIVCSGVTLDHTPPILVRHMFFLPIAKLPEDAYDGTIVPVRNAYFHALDLTVVEDPGAWKAAAGLGGAPLRQEGSKQGQTLDAFIDQDLQAAAATSATGTGRRLVKR